MIYLRIPSIPPTVNHAYSTIRGTNKRVLSTAGKAYKIETATHLVRSYPTALMGFRKNTPYLLVIRFWMDGVENKGYPKTAKNRYKTMDTSNRLKLLEDAMKDACAIDDSQNMTLILQKVQAIDEKEYTEIWAWDLSNETTPFDQPLRDLPTKV